MIPNSYTVETEIFGRKIRCNTEYMSNGKVRYTIIWKEDKCEWSIYNDRSATGAVNAFLKVVLKKFI